VVRVAATPPAGHSNANAAAVGNAQPPSEPRTDQLIATTLPHRDHDDNCPASTFDGIIVPSSADERSPAFQAAGRSCQQVLSGGSPPPLISERQKLAALAQSRCMRKHGVPNFPDPTFSGREIAVDVGGVDPQSPAFKNAETACGSRP
jgi:hypothetical protein